MGPQVGRIILSEKRRYFTMIKTPRTRNRVSKPSWAWSGQTALSWRSETSNVTWAQLDPNFKALVTVLTNERDKALAQPIPMITENRMLGRCEGYELCLATLRSLASTIEPPKPPEDEPTYPANDNDPPDTTFTD